MTYLIAFIASAFVLCFCIYLYVINVKRYVDKEMREKDLVNPKIHSTYPPGYDPDDMLQMAEVYRMARTRENILN